MWGFRRKEENTSQAILDASQPPTPAKPRIEEVPEGYADICSKLGIRTDALVEQEIAQLGLSVYPLRQVERYLDKLFGGREYWKWVPLRKADIVPCRSFNDITSRTYSKAIPLPVLRSIESLDEAGLDLKFFISDETLPGDNKDPFLLITPRDRDVYWVVERWNEPGFRVK